MIKIIFSICLMAFINTQICFSENEKERMFLDITNPFVKKLPLAISEFTHTNKDKNLNIENDIRTTFDFDLNASGIFSLIPQKAFLNKNVDINKFNSEDWKILGASGVITTNYTIQEEKNILTKKIIVEFRLFDVSTGELVIGKRYTGNREDIRVITHKFGNELMLYYTGTYGPFTTKIAFVSQKTGNKEIYIMDWDGKNIKQITFNKSINLAPSWSPDNSKLVYTSFQKGNPDIWMVDLNTMKHKKITEEKGLNIGACFSPDGNHILYAAGNEERSGDTDLILLNINSRVKKKLTSTNGIDISPNISKDGKKIAFVSGRSGNPHIFTMDINGTNVFKITHVGVYNADPTWSPDMKKLVFAGWEKDHFDLFMVNSDATNMERLTKYSKDNEEPSFSPDGRIVVFHSTRKSTSKVKKSDLYIINSNGLGEMPLLENYGLSSSPSWSNEIK